MMCPECNQKLRHSDFEKLIEDEAVSYKEGSRSVPTKCPLCQETISVLIEVEVGVSIQR